MHATLTQKWEYKVEPHRPYDSVQSFLNTCGTDGWELVNIVRDGESHSGGPVKTLRARRDQTVTLFFKRPVQA